MLSEPPGADPHAGWCGRGQGKPGLYPIRWGSRKRSGPKDRQRASGLPNHVVQLANQALDEVRRGYWNELRSLGDPDAAKRCKDARWSLLKKPEKLTDKQARTLARIKSAGGEVWRAYTLKEVVRGISEPGLSLEDVTLLIDRLLSRLARCRLAPLVKLGKTIRRHRDGILAAIPPRDQPRTHRAQQQGPADHPPRLRISLRQGRTCARAAHLRSHHPLPPTRTPRARNRMTHDHIHGERAKIRPAQQAQPLPYHAAARKRA
jgi:hypothetical protein